MTLSFSMPRPAPTKIYTLSLHDALPICIPLVHQPVQHLEQQAHVLEVQAGGRLVQDVERSEEHTSELQSRLHLVCRLLLEKKKNMTPPLSRWARSSPNGRSRIRPPPPAS